MRMRDPCGGRVAANAAYISSLSARMEASAVAGVSVAVSQAQTYSDVGPVHEPSSQRAASEGGQALGQLLVGAVCHALQQLLEISNLVLFLVLKVFQWCFQLMYLKLSNCLPL